MLYQPLRHPPHQCVLFFRDDGLADLIGFQYKDWAAEDAARDLCKHLENIGDFLDQEVGEHVVSIILDGENAWEYYPDNGYHFLRALYQNLTESNQLQMVTYSDLLPVLDPSGVQELAVLTAGSWVYGSFSTWIGDKEPRITKITIPFVIKEVNKEIEISFRGVFLNNKKNHLRIGEKVYNPIEIYDKSLKFVVSSEAFDIYKNSESRQTISLHLFKKKFLFLMEEFTNKFMVKYLPKKLGNIVIIRDTR